MDSITATFNIISVITGQC